MPLVQKEGEEMVRLARGTVDAFVKGSRVDPSGLKDRPFLREVRGAFVTLTEGGDLRGCIGLPYPVKPLGEAVVEAAMGAAGYDPRFPRVEPRELDGILVEVSALTRPEKVQYSSPMELPKLVRVGHDGLIVSNAVTSGLLLPQVATEHGMDSQEFLSNTCIKAGLSADAWLTHRLTVHRFQAEIFSETSPRGTVTGAPDRA
jgi:uncharacterized protein